MAGEHDDPEWVYETPPVPWWERVLVLAGVLLPLGGLVAALWLSRSRSQPPPPRPVTGPGVPPGTGARPGPPLPLAEPAVGLGWQRLLLILAAVALVALLLLGAWLLARRRSRAAAGTVTLGRRRQVAGVLLETVEDLRREPDPR